jgi:arginyl-tRNA synthetase
MTVKEQLSLFKTIGMGALKYHILKVDPKKRILFNPEESIDFNGNTGPFIQYTYARIQSLKRKYAKQVIIPKSIDITDKEQEIIKQLTTFPALIQESAINHSPALVANFIYDLVKDFNNYYQSTAILTAESDDIINFRLGLSLKVGEVIKTAMNLLGSGVPDRM